MSIFAPKIAHATAYGKGDPAQLYQLTEMFLFVISLILQLAGIVFFVLLLLGGFKYLTAGADAAKAEAARKSLTSAIGGLILIILAYLILVVIAGVTGQPGILNFQVFQP